VRPYGCQVSPTPVAFSDTSTRTPGRVLPFGIRTWLIYTIVTSTCIGREVSTVVETSLPTLVPNRMIA
jgi:hypothetical protein